MIKSNTEVTLDTREIYFLYKRPRELKTSKNVVRKYVSQIFVENVLFTQWLA